MLARLAFYVIAGYALLVAVMYVMQRHLQYFPHREYPGTPASNGVPEMREVRVKTEDGIDLLGWFAPPEAKDGKIIVFFHGNAGNLSHRAEKARLFIDHGYGVYLAEYRGFGGNRGSSSEQGLYRDARAALGWLEGEGYSPGQFVLYGESIGSGVAVQMAFETQPKWLVLEAPFTTAADVAKISYFWLPVDLLLKDKYDNLSKIGQIKSALLIVHGDEDHVIPLFLAQKLYEAARHPKEFATVNGGGHADLYDHHAGHIVTEWLDKQAADDR